ncbi:hypothetical protein EYF80_023403 [Liparis tanakae]|uniref:Uncharacterized protein n=1 Tax=Liparis tanakae TaxID=230148 RepID=A0A4Z2HN37_9TELE|nr:hypothetical protein EYF80_023403 [Liparis tanakae]
MEDDKPPSGHQGAFLFIHSEMSLSHQQPFALSDQRSLVNGAAVYAPMHGRNVMQEDGRELLRSVGGAEAALTGMWQAGVKCDRRAAGNTERNRGPGPADATASTGRPAGRTHGQRNNEKKKKDPVRKKRASV